MPRRSRSLDIWLHDELVATVVGTRPGKARLRYSDSALEGFSLGTPVVSCSLPLRTQAQDAYPFLTGLLPEGQHRAVMAGMAGVATHDVIGMLARFGRDVAGALAVVPADEDKTHPHREGVEALDNPGLENAVLEVGDHPLGLYDDSELSLPGLQDKVLLVALPGGRWGRPLHGWPSTHILKLDDRRRPGLVRAEHACLQLATAAGLSAAQSELVTIAGIECLVVTRFDRVHSGHRGKVPAVRLHQEDTCQALGIDADLQRGQAKYEQHSGPSLARVAALLDTYSGPAALLDLLRQVTFTVAIGNADAHGKNISLLHPSPGTVALAPLYDTVPTVVWPRLRTRLALNIATRTDLISVGVEDLVVEAGRWGVSAKEAAPVVLNTLERLQAATSESGLPDTPALGVIAARIGTLLAR